eukprot:1429084-Amphidinium_carterae.1
MQELYRGAKTREMTQRSCARADIVMRNLTENVTGCHWAYSCDGKKDLTPYKWHNSIHSQGPSPEQG